MANVIDTSKLYLNEDFYRYAEKIDYLMNNKEYNLAKENIAEYLKLIGKSQYISIICYIFDALVPFKKLYPGIIVNVLADITKGYIDIAYLKKLYGYSLSTGFLISANSLLKVFKTMEKNNISGVNVEFMQELYNYYYNTYKKNEIYKDKYHLKSVFDDIKRLIVSFNKCKEIQTIIAKNIIEEKAIRNTLIHKKGLSFAEIQKENIWVFYVKYHNNSFDNNYLNYLYKACNQIKAGNYEFSLELLNKSWSLTPNFDSTILALMADVNEKLGYTDKKEFLNKLIKELEGIDYKEVIEEAKYEYLVNSRDSYMYGINNVDFIIIELLNGVNYNMIKNQHSLSNLDFSYCLTLTARECFKAQKIRKGRELLNLAKTMEEDNELKSLIAEIELEEKLLVNKPNISFVEEVKKLIKQNPEE